MFYRFLGIIGCAAGISGCASTIALAPQAPTANGAHIQIVDHRDPQETVYRREHVLADIQYFGDENFDIPPLVQLKAVLGPLLPPGDYTVELTKFRVMDLFPLRAGALFNGGYFGILGAAGYAMIFQNGELPTSDSIACVAHGTIQKKNFTVSAEIPYKISPFAGMVRSDPSYVTATNSCLKSVAVGIRNAL